jgi:PBP1b-binding outer membrane lipoprotein LpoB
MTKKLFSYILVLVLGAFLMSGCEEKADETDTTATATEAVDPTTLTIKSYELK